MAPGLVQAGNAQDTARADRQTPDEKPEQAVPEETPSELEYLAGLILRRYHDDRLDESALTGIVRDLQADLIRGRVLSRFPLTNADEPAFTFGAWRADDPVQEISSDGRGSSAPTTQRPENMNACQNT